MHVDPNEQGDQYYLRAPETMQEATMSDSEDEGGG